MRIEGDPDALLSEEVQATLYQNHPYRVPVIGWMHELEQLNREDALAFYNSFYRPNNAILVVAGDVTPERVRELAEATYGKIERGPELPPRLRPQEPEQNTARTVTLRDERVTLPSFGRQWLVPSYRMSENGEAEALDILAEILGGGTRSRLYQELMVKGDFAANVGAYYNGTMLDETSFTVFGTPRNPADLEKVQAAVMAQVERIKKDGVTADEVERARKRLVRGMVFSRDSSTSMANIYGSALATGSTVKDVADWPDRLAAVTPEQVRDVARKYLEDAVHVTGYLLPAASNQEVR